ncbi:MAG TPA: response regulator [Anaerolineales bacterium]|nr:response regulator [Anaerolineales bacterium]HLO33564.1 response regulator [Anaerolineales bacterium]
MSSVADNQSNPKSLPPLKILVVDDDALNQHLMQVLLTHEGYQVDTASNGLEAFDAIKYGQFDIVFMDLRMPIMDGMEASRRIREWEEGGQHTFIVALTASYLPEEGQSLFEAGMDNYISKPFQMEHLQRMLKYVTKARVTASSHANTTPEEVMLPNEILDIPKKQNR